MNNTFDFNRFKNLLINDGKMYIRNFGTSLIVFCCLPAIFWIFNLLFGTETEELARYGFIFIVVGIVMMIVPSKVYGHANLSREGVRFAMMPASALEKFLSMFVYCAIVTPIVTFFGSYLVDALLSLFPFGGFEKPIHLYTLNELSHVDDPVLDNHAINASLFIGKIRVVLCMLSIMWSSIFMLGNMIFKKHKVGKTFVCYLGINYLFSTLFGAFIFSNTELIEQWVERFKDFAEADAIRLFNNGTLVGLLISIIIPAVLLYFTYRKIKTQKY